MKTIATALLLTATATATTAMPLWTGEKLLQMHAAGERMSKGDFDKKTMLQGFSYVAYVQGVVESNSVTGLFCPPVDAESIAVSDMVVAKLRGREDLRAMPAHVTILGVAREKWPCKQPAALPPK